MRDRNALEPATCGKKERPTNMLVVLVSDTDKTGAPFLAIFRFPVNVAAPLPCRKTDLRPGAETANQRRVLPSLVAVAVVDPDNYRIGGLDRGERLPEGLFHVVTPPRS